MTKTVQVTIELSNAWELWDVDVPDDADVKWIKKNLYGPDCSFVQKRDSGGDEIVTEVEINP